MSAIAIVPVPSLNGVPGKAALQFQTILLEIVQDTITAFAGGGQTNAIQITGQTSRVSTVATAGDSVMLPEARPGAELIVINDGASPMQVYGNGTDTIDNQGATVGVSQMQNSVVIYACVQANKWRSDGLATGFGGPGLQTLSSQDGLTAKIGGAQGGGPAINRMINRFTTVTSGNDSCTLPTSFVGAQITIINGAASNSMNVFPATGDAINALGANNAFALAANKSAVFYCTVSGQWHTVLTA